MRPKWRAGGNCPIEGCSFQFAIGSDDEDELDLVGQAMMQAHADRSHEGMPVNLFGVRQDPRGTIINDEDDEEPGERPRLIN